MKNKNAIFSVCTRVILILFTYLFIGGIFLVVYCEIFEQMFGQSVLELSMLPQKLIFHGFNLLSVVFVVFSFQKFFDGKPILSLGFSFSKLYIDLFYGFIAAFIILGLGIILLLLRGEIEIIHIVFVFNPFWKEFLVFITVAFGEELLFRGYILNNLMESINKYTSLLISSVIFAAFHIFNPNITLLAVFNLFLSGILLGIFYMYSKTLWFSISHHFFWNFMQGPILGFKVSGQNTNSVISLRIKGEDIISGGDFGFEGSILCSLFSLIVILIIAIVKLNETTKIKPE